MTDIIIGIDISKDTLDAYRHPDGDRHRVDNTAAGHKALIAWIRASPVKQVVYEPTGAYHRALEQALGKADLPLVKINPRKVRRFADAIGQQAKTDPLDAALLARMAAMCDLSPKPVPDQRLVVLQEMLVARTALVKDRTAARNRTKTVTLHLLKRQIDRRLKQIDYDIAQVDEQIMAKIKADPTLAQRFAILASIPGIGDITACTLLITMPELGQMQNAQAASLAGLAPITRQSGRWTGKAHIRGGRANARHALYMPALVATRFNPDLKAKYDHLISLGKPTKLAITAIMRKLIVLANALLKANRKWTPKQACA